MERRQRAWRLLWAALFIASIPAIGAAPVNTSLFTRVELPALLEASPSRGWIYGGAWLDVDGDGDLDFAVPGDRDEGVQVQWVENLGGDAGFAARTLDPNIEGLPDESTLGLRSTALAADFNNDGKVDLYVSGCINFFGMGHPLPCALGVFYENLGGGRFRAHEDAGLLPTIIEYAAAAGDVNGDGLLDLYVTEGRPYRQNFDITGFTSKLYINKGDFVFEESGIDVDNPGTCSVTFVDFDNDGDQDIVTGSCFLLQNRENPTPFQAMFGAIENIPGRVRLLKNTLTETGELDFVDATQEVFGDLEPGFWFGMSLTDLNDDGRVDFYFGNSGDFEGVNQQHTLLISQPDGTYRNESVDRGVAFWEFNWGSDFVDANNDGLPDLVSVGALSDNAPWIRARNPGRVLLNDGAGSFVDRGDLGLSRTLCVGLSTADYDEDGSQDLMVVCSAVTTPNGTLVFSEPGQLALFRGTAQQHRHVSFELRGDSSNRQGIGASVRTCAKFPVTSGGDLWRVSRRCQMRVVTAGSSFASTHSPVVHFGVPEGAGVVDVYVAWPSGRFDSFEYVAVGHRYLIEEGSANAIRV